MSTDRPRLVILGTGFASFSLVKAIDVERYEVVIVSPRNHFLFTPLLPSTTVGTIEFRSIIEPIRTARRGIHYHQASCVDIDPTNNSIECQSAFENNRFTLNYDLLVVGVGCVSNTFNIPGVETHALFLKELADARAIRSRISDCLEQASQPGSTNLEMEALLHFVVVGGGPTGVEFAGEMHDFVTEDLSKWFPDLMPLVRITLLEATGEILTSFDERLSTYALRHLKRARIHVRTNAFVKEVKPGGVLLSTNEEIPCGLVVWSTGIGPTNLAQKADLPRDKQGRLITDAAFRVLGHENVYAIGDCSRVESENLAATAQVAQQEGEYVAHRLNQLARGCEPDAFKYHHRGMLAYLGGSRAIADLQNVKARGFTTWLLWRSVYLTKLVSTKNKILVVGDWLQTLLFGRDISRF
jgi:NADH:ubiquinone reductase (non-electrogenic)